MYYKTVRRSFPDNGYVETDSEDSSNLAVGPERNLLSSVLERAALDLLDPAFREDALAWFEEPEVDSPDFMSFQSICIQLELDQEIIKRAILVQKVPLRRRTRKTK